MQILYLSANTTRATVDISIQRMSNGEHHANSGGGESFLRHPRRNVFCQAFDKLESVRDMKALRIFLKYVCVCSVIPLADACVPK